MTFIYELDPYSLEIYRMCENEFSSSRLSEVILSDIQTDTLEIIIDTVSGKKGATLFFAITLSNNNRSSKFFYNRTQQ